MTISSGPNERSSGEHDEPCFLDDGDRVLHATTSWLLMRRLGGLLMLESQPLDELPPGAATGCLYATTSFLKHNNEMLLWCGDELS